MQGRYRDGIPDEGKRKLMGCAFSGAILVAPFIALLLSLKFGLAVLALALAAITWFAVDALREATGEAQRNLRVLVVVNAMLLVCTIAVLIVI